MSSETGLRLVDVSVRYGSVAAVAGATLAAEQGSVTALLGPSGCGKSTLLRAIAGLEPMTSGSVQWRGRDLAGVAVHERRIGLMFQDHALFPHRNVADNVGFGLRMAGIGRKQRSERVRELLALVDLPGMGERTVGTLSGGQAQRVALARALAPEPELLLLDEPLGSLDRQLRDRLVHEIRRVVTELGITTIHVTHDHDEAISIADSIAFMADGAIVGHGPTSDLLMDPGTVGVARALALDTLFEGDIEVDGIVTTPFGPLTAPPGRPWVLLRPEDVQLLTGTPATDASGGVAARVVASRHHGDAWHITCRTGDGVRIVARYHSRLDPETHVWLVADLSEARFLAR